MVADELEQVAEGPRLAHGLSGRGGLLIPQRQIAGHQGAAGGQKSEAEKAGVKYDWNQPMGYGMTVTLKKVGTVGKP